MNERAMAGRGMTTGAAVPTAPSDASRLLGMVEKLEGEAAHLSAQVSGVHSQLFGPEPRGSDEKGPAPVRSGVLISATDRVAEVVALLVCVSNELRDVQERLTV